MEITSWELGPSGGRETYGGTWGRVRGSFKMRGARAGFSVNWEISG